MSFWRGKRKKTLNWTLPPSGSFSFCHWVVLCFCCSTCFHFHRTENTHTRTSQNQFFTKGAAVAAAYSSPPVCVLISSKCECDAFSWWEQEEEEAAGTECGHHRDQSLTPLSLSLSLSSCFPFSNVHIPFFLSVSCFRPVFPLHLCLSHRYFLFSLLLTSQKKNSSQIHIWRVSWSELNSTFPLLFHWQSKICVPQAFESSVTTWGKKKKIKKLPIWQEDSVNYITVAFLKFDDTRGQATVSSPLPRHLSWTTITGTGQLEVKL